MNRTITMNLSGVIFHIEEDAYEKLNKYLSTIKGYFNSTEGRDEIMADIESRIAEMLQEKVSNTKQAVLLADVESIINIMGKPEDFASDSENNPSQKNNQENTYTENPRYRRLFRDPDDKVLGGVCSGMAHYFNIDPVWIRAAFAIAFFVFGSGFLLYCVLWIIIPVAKTTAEKLQMRGEKVDINNIGKVVNEEFNDLKKRVNKFGEEITSPERKERFRNSARSFSNFLGTTLGGILLIIGKILAIALLIISIVLLTGLLAVIFGKGNFMFFDDDSQVQFSLYEIASSIFPSGISSELAATTLILFCGIPLLLIIYNMVRILFNIRQHNRIVNIVAGVLWLIGIGLVVYIGVRVGNDFSTEAYVKNKVELTQPKNKKLYLDIAPFDDEHTDNYYPYKKNGNKLMLDNWIIFAKEDNHYRLGYPTVDIIPSATDSFQVVVIQEANGYDKKEATMYARNISYNIQQKDSLLLFDSYFDVPQNDKFRAQNVKVILKVPLNSSIYLGNKMKRVIYDIDNITNILDRDMVNRSWLMTQEGLACLDCNGDEQTVGRSRHTHISIHNDDNEHQRITIEKDYDTEDLRKEGDKKVVIRKKVNLDTKGDKGEKGRKSNTKVILEKEVINDEKN